MYENILFVIVGLVFGSLFVWILFVLDLKRRLEAEMLKSTSLQNELIVLSSKLESQQEICEQKLLFLEQNKEHLRSEFKELADTILEQNSKKFSSQNQESLDRLLTPIREQFGEFKKQIDDVYIKEAKDRSMLQAEIKSIKEINHQMSLDAKNLTKALKGESKTQGLWGEMVLQSILDTSGLREGEEYEKEKVLSSQLNSGVYRPDVVVHLPHSRDIIIDAKTSLSAYEMYVNAKSDQEQEVYKKEHIQSIKNHIKLLSQKDYMTLKGMNSLDFVFMFVPIESALLLALQTQSSLFDEAFKKGIVLVGPTTLMISLKAIEHSWQSQKQENNAKEIALRAGLLYDKFVLFVESVEKLSKQLGVFQKSFDETFSRMHTGVGSITSQFHKLKLLGAKNSKNLDDEVLRKLDIS